MSRPTKLNPKLPGNFWFNGSSFTDRALALKGTPRPVAGSSVGWACGIPDFTVRKDFAVTESSYLQTEIDFFNFVRQHELWPACGRLRTGYQFGEILGIRAGTNLRLIQLGGKFAC